MGLGYRKCMNTNFDLTVHLFTLHTHTYTHKPASSQGQRTYVPDSGADVAMTAYCCINKTNVSLSGIMSIKDMSV